MFYHTRFTLLLVSIVVLMLCSSASFAGIIYVKTDGNDANDGSTWALAKLTVQAGLDAAVSGDEVWVAAGTYVENIILKDGVGLYGGFAGTETLKETRDPTANIAILMGDRIDPVIGIPSGATAATVLDGFIVRNGWHGVDCSFSAPTLRGNKIYANLFQGIRCYASSPMLANNIVIGNQDGVYCEMGSPVLTGNTIVGNSCGVGDYYGSPTVANNIIAFNYHGVDGSHGAPVLWCNDVYGNSMDYDGIEPGIGDISEDPLFTCLEFGNLHIEPTSSCRNAGDNFAPGLPATDIDGQDRIQEGTVDIGADESDGTMGSCEPHVVYVDAASASEGDGATWPTAYRTIGEAVNDVTTVRGAEIWVAQGTYEGKVTLLPFAHLYGGFVGVEANRGQRDWRANATIIEPGGWSTAVKGASVSTIDGFTITNGWWGVEIDGCTMTVTNNRIIGNLSWAMYCYDSSPLIANNTIADNSRDGIYCASGSPTITNNTITGNKGDGIRGSGHSVSSTITNNTIAGNSGCGVYCRSSSPMLANNVVAFNSSGIRSSYYATPVLKHNCVYENARYDYSGLPPGAGDISQDPLFVDRAGGDYHLAAGSPCIDAGDDTVVQPADRDIDGQPRQVDIPGKGAVGTLVDIGADELWPIFVTIDIKPGEYPNTINLRSRGLVPVVILTTEDFDATTVDPATVEMAGSAVATRGKKAKLLFSQSDVDKDGDTDLLVLFDTQNLALDAGATEATLTGETYDGTLIQGSDSVVVILKE